MAADAPSAPGTTTSASATGAGQQTKTFYVNGRHWAFYSDGTNFVWQSSTDGAAWDAKQTARATSVATGTSIALDGNNFHMVSGSTYRKGTLNADGTITWIAAEQDLSGIATFTGSTIAVDNAYHAFIGYRDAANKPYVIDNTATDGTWATGTNQKLDDTADTQWRVHVTSMSSGRMYAIYARGAQLVLGAIYSAGAWTTNEAVSTSNVEEGAFVSITNIGDTIHAVFLKNDAGTRRIIYVKRTYGVGWGAEAIIKSGVNW